MMLLPFAIGPACTASACTVSTNLTPLWYTLGILGSLVIVVGAAFKGVDMLKRRWTAEGEEKSKLAAALDVNSEAAKANAEATKANTQAIGAMNQRMADYMQHTDERLNTHQRRIERLEDRLPRPPH